MKNVRKYLTVWMLISLTAALVVVPESSALGDDENTFNIKYITTTTYRFMDPLNPITHLILNTTGNVRAGPLPVSVEVLMNTSDLIKPSTSAPGFVFKNVNIWLGKGDLTNERNIEKALIGFRVDNSWLESNGLSAGDVKMVRWDGSKWRTLKTKLKEKDGTFTYFEAETSNFSPFAINAMKAITEAKPGGFFSIYRFLEKIYNKIITALP